jgi:hypothetical protein
MWFWWITVVIVIAGALGGVVNALMSDSGFILPGRYDEGGNKIWKPGALGNISWEPQQPSSLGASMDHSLHLY